MPIATTAIASIAHSPVCRFTRIGLLWSESTDKKYAGDCYTNDLRANNFLIRYPRIHVRYRNHSSAAPTCGMAPPGSPPFARLHAGGLRLLWPHHRARRYGICSHPLGSTIDHLSAPPPLRSWRGIWSWRLRERIPLDHAAASIDLKAGLKDEISDSGLVHSKSSAHRFGLIPRFTARRARQAKIDVRRAYPGTIPRTSYAAAALVVILIALHFVVLAAASRDGAAAREHCKNGSQLTRST